MTFVATDTCTGVDICIEGVCRAFMGRSYTIAITGILMPERRLSEGTCWDLACGAPDPVAELQIDMTLVGRTEVTDDSFEVGFDPPWLHEHQTIFGSTWITLSAWDNDGVVDDEGFECEFQVSPQRMRERNITCAGDGGAFGLVAFVLPDEEI